MERAVPLLGEIPLEVFKKSYIEDSGAYGQSRLRFCLYNAGRYTELGVAAGSQPDRIAAAIERAERDSIRLISSTDHRLVVLVENK